MAKNPVAKNVNRVHRPQVIPSERDEGPELCEVCKGAGEIVDVVNGFNFLIECFNCGGEGYV